METFVMSAAACVLLVLLLWRVEALRFEIDRQRGEIREHEAARTRAERIQVRQLDGLGDKVAGLEEKVGEVYGVYFHATEEGDVKPTLLKAYAPDDAADVRALIDRWEQRDLQRVDEARTLLNAQE